MFIDTVEPEDLRILQDLADFSGAVVGCSRPVVCNYTIVEDLHRSVAKLTSKVKRRYSK